MDKKTLVTIAVTTVVVVTITEVVKWLLSLAKSTATSTTTRQNARKLFSKNNLTIAGDVFALLLFILLLWSEMRDKSPITRRDVLNIVSYTVFIMFWTFHLVFDLSTRKMRRQWSDLNSRIKSLASEIDTQKDETP
jgi:hypothetical protein